MIGLYYTVSSGYGGAKYMEIIVNILQDYNVQ